MAQSAQRKKPAAKATKNNPTNSAPRPTLDARPDRLDLRDLPYRAPLRSLPPRWPLDADLKRLLPAYVKAGRILNQGDEGACTGFGLACVTNYLYWLRHLETPRSKLPPLVSPRMFYELAKLYDEWPGQDYEGSSCRGALKGWHKHGVCRWDLWPYPIDKNNQGVFVRPLPGWEQDATTRPLGVYYRVDKHSVVDMQAAIHEIGAVYVSGSVHKGWGVDVTGLPSSHADLPRIQRMARSTGGHAFALVGYNEHGFVVQNSWGTDWGASGFAVLSYEDWVTNGSDCWAVALGVPQDLSDLQPAAPRAAKAGKAAPAASGFRVASGAGLATVGATLRVDDNPRDDPWPFHHDFDHKAYQPLRTAEAYTHTLVSGNDGVLMATDFTRARSDRAGLAREIVVERPLAWFKGRKDKTLKLALYAHGGLNSESESIQRIRVLAPYFLANGIYPLFFTWKTGPGETLLDMLEDLGHRIVGGADRSDGVLDQLREAAAEAKDRAIEAVGRQFARGIWTEMRENAAGGAAADHVLDLASRMLRELRSALATSGAQLELHLVGHSAGSILLGHLLDRLGGADVLPVNSCELYAAACSSGFAVEHYGRAHQAGVLPLQALHLRVLTDANERADGLPTPEHPIYGKSLLYLVSRALDEVRKQPLLGMERALIPSEPAWVADQWAVGPNQAPNADVAAWLRLWPGGALLGRVTTPKVRTTKTGDQIAASHGSFDNNIDVMTATLVRLRGAPLVAPMEWLDF
ncbi:MAG: peptidase C1 [Burkholderiales bacterium]|uniref:C1 family peptidase n=1 Tax=Roseateles sp. TaxID=1971397 RepID=UPI000FA8A5DF|nr:MAG: peptidase C1 [Burkholderiales bacterium]